MVKRVQGITFFIRLLGLKGRVNEQPNHSFLNNKNIRFKLLSFMIIAEKMKNKAIIAK